MNSTVYLFGELGQRYSQYPTDYTQLIFQRCAVLSKEKTQLIIHRDTTLMYYSYIRKLDDAIAATPQYIGICIVVNGIYFTDIDKLFSIFEDSFTHLTVNGEIIGFTDKGSIVARTSRLNEQINEVEKIKRFIQGEIIQLSSTSKELPPVSYGIANNESKYYSIKDNPTELKDASFRYGYTVISKENGYNTHSLSSYKGIVRKINQEKEEITNKFNELSKQHAIVLNQKKQIKWVAILLAAIIIGSIIFFAEKDKMQNQISYLDSNITSLNEIQVNLEKRINEQEQELSNQKNTISTLRTNLNVTTNEKIKAENIISEKETEIENLTKILAQRESKIKQLQQQNSQTYAQTSSNYNSNDLYITHPSVSSSPKNLKIISVKITYAHTIIDLEYENTYNVIGVNISPQTYIISYNTGKRYYLIQTEGIKIAPQKTTLQQRKTRFKLIFPVLPKNTTKFNLIEEGTGWQIYGIKLQ